VLTTDTTAATTIFFCLYNGANVVTYDDGSTPTVHTFAELSQLLSDATKSPAAGAANKNYDMFVWNDAGTMRCTRGPAWSSDTSRGTGVGTTELSAPGGVWRNLRAITNGPAALTGTYVGTIRTDGNTQCNMMFAPAGVAGGSSNRLDVWNMYNRVLVSSINDDSVDNYEYHTGGWRAKNNNVHNETSFIVGLSEDFFHAINIAACIPTGGGSASVGWGYDATLVLDSHCATGDAASGSNGLSNFQAVLDKMPDIGFHFVCPIEIGQGGANNVQWYFHHTFASQPVQHNTRFLWRM
jgi:hypothetical protein